MLLLLALAACATRGGEERRTDFHSAEEPSALRERVPPPASLFGGEMVDVDRWELEGPLPDRIEVRLREPSLPFEAILGQAAAARPGLVVLTESMHCTAREVERFRLSKGALPGESLRRFMASRCGSPVVGVELAYLHGEVPPDLAEEAVLEQWDPTCRRWWPRRSAGEAETLGSGSGGKASEPSRW